MTAKAILNAFITRPLNAANGFGTFGTGYDTFFTHLHVPYLTRRLKVGHGRCIAAVGRSAGRKRRARAKHLNVPAAFVAGEQKKG